MPIVLVVDDDEAARTTLARMLAGPTRRVELFGTAEEVVRRIENGGAEVVVSDIVMPSMTGLDLLRAVRKVEPDLPVVLVTGTPAVETAIAAVESGAFRYLVKPVSADTLRAAVDAAVKAYRLALAKREALALQGDGARPPSDRVGLELCFERALSGLWMAFQPILKTSDGTTYGHEALVRSSEAALPGPNHLLEAAERLDALHLLGRTVRRLAAEPMVDANGAGTLFVNLHPRDLVDDALYERDSPLGRLATRVVLEVTERASLDRVQGIRSRVARLREMGFRIAVDDLGAGYAGLASFALLEPEVVKLDMAIIRGIDTNHVKQKVVRSITTMCRDMGLLVVAEGIETRGERDTLVELECDLVQGYHFARPDRPFPKAVW